MAHVLKRMLKSCPCVLDLTRSSALRSLPIRRSWVRYYAPNYKKRVPEEDLKEMKEYREKVLALRRQYREQWRAKGKRLESISEQLDEELQQEKIMAEKALEMNKLENERLAQKREKTKAMKKKIKELSIEAAAVARQENEMVVREERNTQVEKLQRESIQFITFDNLDAKVQEAVDNEVDLNFALTPSGTKIRNNY